MDSHYFQLFQIDSFQFKSEPPHDYYATLLLPELRIALYHIMDVYHFAAGSIYLPSIDNNTFEIFESVGFNDEYLKDTHKIISGVGFCGTALGLNEIRVTEDVENDSRYNRPLIKKFGFKSFVAMPLHPQIGLINLASYEERNFSAAELSMYSFIGKHLGDLCHNRILLEEAEDYVKISQRLSIFSAELINVSDIKQIAILVVEECRAFLNSPVTVLCLMSTELFMTRSTGAKKETISQEFRKYLKTFQSEEDIFVLSFENDNHHLHRFLEQNKLRSLYCINIICQNNYVGTICFGRTNNNPRITISQIYAFRRIRTQLSSAINRYFLNQHSLTLAILEEQTRLSRELHDSMSQQIVATQRQLEFIQQAVKDRTKADIDSEFALAYDMLTELYDGMREIVSELRSIKKIDSIENTLRKYFDLFIQTYPLKIDFEITPGLVLPMIVQLQLIRIIQEAMTNIRNHSKAKNVIIILNKQQDNTLMIRIDDDGVGFNTENIGDNHFGLNIMKERTEGLAGTFKLLSNLNCGTKIHIVIPLES
jgi:signal transduction histidine kinase